MIPKSVIWHESLRRHLRPIRPYFQNGPFHIALTQSNSLSNFMTRFSSEKKAQQLQVESTFIIWLIVNVSEIVIITGSPKWILNNSLEQ